ncbi:hypothetical protein LTS18_005424, partial [Coniosporium uncinatum]
SEVGTSDLLSASENSVGSPELDPSVSIFQISTSSDDSGDTNSRPASSTDNTDDLSYEISLQGQISGLLDWSTSTLSEASSQDESSFESASDSYIQTPFSSYLDPSPSSIYYMPSSTSFGVSSFDVSGFLDSLVTVSSLYGPLETLSSAEPSEVGSQQQSLSLLGQSSSAFDPASVSEPISILQSSLEQRSALDPSSEHSSSLSIADSSSSEAFVDSSSTLPGESWMSSGTLVTLMIGSSTGVSSAPESSIFTDLFPSMLESESFAEGSSSSDVSWTLSSSVLESDLNESSSIWSSFSVTTLITIIITTSSVDLSSLLDSSDVPSISASLELGLSTIESSFGSPFTLARSWTDSSISTSVLAMDAETPSRSFSDAEAPASLSTPGWSLSSNSISSLSPPSYSPTDNPASTLSSTSFAEALSRNTAQANEQLLTSGSGSNSLTQDITVFSILTYSPTVSVVSWISTSSVSAELLAEGLSIFSGLETASGMATSLEALTASLLNLEPTSSVSDLSRTYSETASKSIDRLTLNAIIPAFGAFGAVVEDSIIAAQPTDTSTITPTALVSSNRAESISDDRIGGMSSSPPADGSGPSTVSYYEFPSGTSSDVPLGSSTPLESSSAPIDSSGIPIQSSSSVMESSNDSLSSMQTEPLSSATNGEAFEMGTSSALVVFVTLETSPIPGVTSSLDTSSIMETLSAAETLSTFSMSLSAMSSDTPLEGNTLLDPGSSTWLLDNSSSVSEEIGLLVESSITSFHSTATLSTASISGTYEWSVSSTLAASPSSGTSFVVDTGLIPQAFTTIDTSLPYESLSTPEVSSSDEPSSKADPSSDPSTSFTTPLKTAELDVSYTSSAQAYLGTSPYDPSFSRSEEVLFTSTDTSIDRSPSSSGVGQASSSLSEGTNVADEFISPNQFLAESQNPNSDTTLISTAFSSTDTESGVDSLSFSAPTETLVSSSI